MYGLLGLCYREIKFETVVSSQGNSPSETLERKCKAAENKIFELEKSLEFKVEPCSYTCMPQTYTTWLLPVVSVNVTSQ